MRLLVGHRSKWEDDIKMNPKEIAYKVVDWMQQAQDGFQSQARDNIIITLRGP